MLDAELGLQGAQVCLVITVPCILASTALTGLPGMTRGMKKSTVTAAIAVRM